jgi:hypothetical protein
MREPFSAEYLGTSPDTDRTSAWNLDIRIPSPIAGASYVDFLSAQTSLVCAGSCQSSAWVMLGIRHNQLEYETEDS